MTETLNCFQKHTHQQKAYAGELKVPQQNPVPTELRQELCMLFFCHSEDVNQYIPAKFQDCGVFCCEGHQERVLLYVVHQRLFRSDNYEKV